MQDMHYQHDDLTTSALCMTSAQIVISTDPRKLCINHVKLATRSRRCTIVVLVVYCDVHSKSFRGSDNTCVYGMV